MRVGGGYWGLGPLRFEICHFPVNFLVKKGCSLSFERVKWNFTVFPPLGKMLLLEKILLKARARNTSWFTAIFDSPAGSTPRLDQASSEMQSFHLLLDWPLGRFLVGATSKTCLASLPRGILDAWTNYRRGRSIYSGKWFNIQGFTNFTVAHFFAKFPSLPLYLK